jgi:hypothetical protein
MSLDLDYRCSSWITTQKCWDFHCVFCPERSTKETFMKRWVVFVKNRITWPRIIDNYNNLNHGNETFLRVA